MSKVTAAEINRCLTNYDAYLTTLRHLRDLGVPIGAEIAWHEGQRELVAAHASSE